MLKIADAVEEVVLGNALLSFGLHHRLLNLSQTARFIHSLIEAKTMKEVQVAAIHMALSRLQNKHGATAAKQPEAVILDQITLHSGLSCYTYLKTKETHGHFHALLAEIQAGEGFITITEGISEITAIVETRFKQQVKSKLKDKPVFVTENLASLGVKFRRRDLARPGLIYLILQQLAIQNISITEVSSTATEFNIYLEEHHVQQAFDAIYQKFHPRRHIGGH